MAVLQRRWASGELSASIAQGRSLTPQQVPVRGPSQRQLTGQYALVRTWLDGWQVPPPGIRVEFAATGTRIVGMPGIPVRAWVDDVDDLQAVLGAGPHLRQLEQMLDDTEMRMPWLTTWVKQNLHHLASRATVWPQLLDVVAWTMEHHGAALHLRRLDLPSSSGRLDFTFVDEHRQVLASLLEQSLVSDRIDPHADPHDVRRRFRLTAPLRLRVRRLNGRPVSGRRGPRDLGLTVDDLAVLRPSDIRAVLLLHSEFTYEALPYEPHILAVLLPTPQECSVAPAMAPVSWLHEVDVVLWADIATRGLAELDALRTVAPKARSVLMDPDTLHLHRDRWDVEPDPVRRPLPHLTPVEQAVYRTLAPRSDGTSPRLRQDRIGFQHVKAAMDDLAS